MNSLKKIAALSLAAFVALSLNGCNKEDTTPPDITILGNNPFNLEVLATYNDPGATAEDDEDEVVVRFFFVVAVTKSFPHTLSFIFSLISYFQT